MKKQCRQFVCIILVSMILNPSAVLKSYYSSNQFKTVEWSENQTLKSDEENCQYGKYLLMSPAEKALFSAWMLFIGVAILFSLMIVSSLLMLYVFEILNIIGWIYLFATIRKISKPPTKRQFRTKFCFKHNSKTSQSDSYSDNYQEPKEKFVLEVNICDSVKCEKIYSDEPQITIETVKEYLHTALGLPVEKFVFRHFGKQIIDNSTLQLPTKIAADIPLKGGSNDEKDDYQTTPTFKPKFKANSAFKTCNLCGGNILTRTRKIKETGHADIIVCNTCYQKDWRKKREKPSCHMCDKSFFAADSPINISGEVKSFSLSVLKRNVTKVCKSCSKDLESLILQQDNKKTEGACANPIKTDEKIPEIILETAKETASMNSNISYSETEMTEVSDSENVNHKADEPHLKLILDNDTVMKDVSFEEKNTVSETNEITSKTNLDANESDETHIKHMEINQDYTCSPKLLLNPTPTVITDDPFACTKKLNKHTSDIEIEENEEIFRFNSIDIGNSCEISTDGHEKSQNGCNIEKITCNENVGEKCIYPGCSEISRKRIFTICATVIGKIVNIFQYFACADRQNYEYAAVVCEKHRTTIFDKFTHIKSTETIDCETCHRSCNQFYFTNLFKHICPSCEVKLSFPNIIEKLDADCDDLSKILESTNKNHTRNQIIKRISLLKAFSHFAKNILKNNPFTFLYSEIGSIYNSELSKIIGKISEIQTTKKRFWRLRKKFFVRYLKEYFPFVLSLHDNRSSNDTMIYIKGIDLLNELANTLKKCKKMGEKLESKNSFGQEKVNDESKDCSILMKAAMILNGYFLEQCKSNIEKFSDSVLSFDKLDTKSMIENINPKLWNFFHVMLSANKCQQEKFNWQEHNMCGLESESDSNKNIWQRIFILYSHMFDMNPRCGYPLHVMIADLVESQGGSDKLINALSKFGITVCRSTHRRFIQIVINAIVNAGGPLRKWIPGVFGIGSVDNLDRRAPKAEVRCNQQSRCWNGTTVLISQPQPFSLKENQSERNIEKYNQDYKNSTTSNNSNTSDKVSNNDDISSNPALNTRELKNTFLSKVPVFGDGNCLFRALASSSMSQLSNAIRTPSGWILDATMRAKEDLITKILKVGIIKVLRKNIMLFKSFPEIFKKTLLEKDGADYASFEERIDAIEKNVEYSGYLELAAAAVLLQCPIRLYTEESNLKYRHYDTISDPKLQNVNPINLLYRNSNGSSVGHYDLLMPFEKLVSEFNYVGSSEQNFISNWQHVNNSNKSNKSALSMADLCKDFLNDSSKSVQIPDNNCNESPDVTKDHSYPVNNLDMCDTAEETNVLTDLPVNDHSYSLNIDMTYSSEINSKKRPMSPKLKENCTLPESKDYWSEIPKTKKAKLAKKTAELSSNFTELSYDEKESLNELETNLFWFATERGVESEHFTHPKLPGLKCKLLLDQNIAIGHVEKSNLIYKDVINAPADNLDTMDHVLDQIHREFIIEKGLDKFIVAGDAKTYEYFLKLKEVKGKTFDWLIPFMGDFHILYNYHKVIKRLFWDAGLHKLGELFHKGSTLTSLENSHDFRKNHRFLLQVWEAMFRRQISKFFEWRKSNSTLCSFTQENIECELIDLIKSLNCDNNYSDVQDFVAQQALLKQKLVGLEEEFKDFREQMSNLDKTFRFWDSFVHKDCLYYIGLHLAVRSGNWNLRVGCLKKMIALFRVCDFRNYAKFLPKHIADLRLIPEQILDNLKAGGFVCSLKGTPFESQAFDETHESTINRDVKMSISRNNEDLIVSKGLYLPFRANLIENILFQIGYLKSNVKHKGLSAGTIKAENNNIAAYCKTLSHSLLFCTDNMKQVLVHIFNKSPASDKAQSDLIEHYEIGEKLVENMIPSILQESSKPITFQRRNLATFTEKKPTKSQTTRKQKENEKLLGYYRKTLSHSYHHNKPAENFGQYLELPRAIATIDGLPYKGCGKSNIKKFYQSAYQTKQTIFSGDMPQERDTVILEGMFLINKSPMGFMNTFKDYGEYFLKNSVHRYLNKGFRQVHILFDDPWCKNVGPKDIERQRRDSNLEPSTTELQEITVETKLPNIKWEQFIKNRHNKALLCEFLSNFIIQNGSDYLNDAQSIIVAGAFKGEKQNCAMIVNCNECSVIDKFKCNHEETDSRIWFHVNNIDSKTILIYSPDTDVYHIGLPLCTDKDITIELCNTFKKEEYLSLSAMRNALSNDLDMNKLTNHEKFKYIQTIFVTSGCDYVSFFSGFSKSTFMKIAIKFVSFIAYGCYSHKDFTAGSILRCPPSGCVDCENQICFSCQCTINHGLLGFYRLIGCLYFSSSGIGELSPVAHFEAFVSAQNIQTTSYLEQHKAWLDNIRSKSLLTGKNEQQVIPSNDALYRHWLRSVFVLLLWEQALETSVQMPTLYNYGWKNQGNGRISIDWDSNSNLNEIRDRVAFITKGCGCKGGCLSNRCSCKRSNKYCGPGCICIKCENNSN